MKTYSLRAVGWVLWCWAIGCFPSALGAAPRFEVPRVSAGQVTLRLTGENGVTLRVESSTNLTAWTEVRTGTLAGGVWQFDEVQPVAAKARYYRAVQEGVFLPFPTVRYLGDTNLTGSSVLEPGWSSEIKLTSPSGQEVVLRFPTNAVERATLVSMTWVTNLTGVPAERGWVTGVKLEPEGLVLSAPAVLDLPLDASVPASRVSSYSFGADGSHLHLVPDVVTTHRARVFVGQLRGYGAGVFTLEELTALASTVPPARARAGSRPSLHASMEECYPEDEAAAKALREELEDLMAPEQQRIAKVLGIERQKQLLGVTDEDAAGMTALAELMAAAGEFYVKEIRSRIPAASQRCATAREMMSWVLGFSRQEQLLGVENGAASEDSSSLICAGLKQCQDQALECCRTRGGDTRLVSFLLGLERQRQLLGVTDAACGQPLDVEGVLDDCAPKWFGTLTYSLRGSYETNRSDSVALNEERRKLEYKFEALVESVEETIVEPFLFIPGHTNLTFQLVGSAQGVYSVYSLYDDLFEACGSTPSGKALATVRPHDGGESLLRRYQADSQIATNGLQLTLRATLMAPGSAGAGITPQLNISIPYLSAPLNGFLENVLDSVTSDGCEVTDTSGPVKTTHTFDGASYLRGTGGFGFNPRSITFLRLTPKLDGPMVVQEEVRLELKRLR